ncbi:hypothetical protein TREMEDRAFT_16695, partial [Tremella mesenterica DSM 1558]|uniref:uncharacterized protein n=1 Tax=Tremella mesenterica (strain ATCC 24925 / CBS 8224 / DSM 1558 / NBRC 9311 / NRRL Y-6157 / RJB 2259-6 / UBC 559-6) TaxID=578456 RepID=UPI0003F496F9
MTTPISFTVRPPSTAPFRPSPLGNGARPSSRTTGPPSRRLFESHGEDSDDDERHNGSSGRRREREERINGLSNGRIVGGNKPEEPLVIPTLPNKDWRATTRRVPSFRPQSRVVQTDETETRERIGDEEQKAGLRFAVKTEVKSEMGISTIKTERVEEISSNGGGDVSTTTTTSTTAVKKEPLSLEEQALQAILAGDGPQETAEQKLQRELIISMGGSGVSTPLTEDDAYRRDIEALPEESTADDYAAIPVSAFGYAMARGMGWDPKANDNTPIHVPKTRPQLLGLGATPLDVVIPSEKKSNGQKKK